MKNMKKFFAGTLFAFDALIVLIIALVIGFLFVQAVIDNAHLKSTLNEWESETEAVPSYVMRIHTLCRGEEETAELPYRNALLVEGDTVWYVKDEWQREDDTYLWRLVSSGMDGTDETVHYEGVFASDFEDGATMESSGFCREGKIVLHGAGKTVVYDLALHTYTEYEEQECSFLPPLRAEIQDSETVLFTKDGESKVFSVGEAAKDSAAWQYVWERAGKKTHSTRAQFDGIVNVQTLEDKTYIICALYNYTGHGYVIAFEYDFESNRAKYCTWAFISSYADDNFYFIPTR